MLKIYSHSSHSSEVELILDTLSKNESIKSIMIFFADSASLELEKLGEIFKKQEKTIMGGIFPEIIFESEKITEGFYILAWSDDIETKLITLKDNQLDYEKELDSFSKSLQHVPKTLWVLMDAFAKNKNSIIDAIYNEFGPSINYIGGGAGTLALRSTPCIISNDGISNECALLGIMKNNSKVGVAHGWHPISEPVKVTEVEGAMIKSFEWKNAFDYYYTKIKEHSGEEITQENFFQIAKSYPLGITKLNSELIVRDPISTNGNYLQIIDEVPENEFIQILNGDKSSLFKGAALASHSAISTSDSQSILFCIDCISRVLFLGEHFKHELKEISEEPNIYGILTIGEIANSGNSMLEIFNKTVVVCNIQT